MSGDTWEVERTNLSQAIRSTGHAPRVIIYALWHMKAALFGDYYLRTLNRDIKNHEDSYRLRCLYSRVRVYLPRSFVSLKLGTTALAVYIPRLCQINAFKIATFFCVFNLFSS